MSVKTIVYCIVPRIGGTFNFYKNLRSALRPYGWNVLGVSSGEWECSHWQDEFADDGCIQVASRINDPVQIAKELVKWVSDNKVDIFIPMSSCIAASAVRHLPTSIHAVNRCNNITRYTYDIVCNNEHYISRIIATSKRQYNDLYEIRNISKERLVFIPHGLPVEAFNQVYKQRQINNKNLRLGYVGRLSHHDKGCLHLPELVANLAANDINFTLDIVGSGADEDKLKQKMSPFLKKDNIRFLGRKPNNEIPGLLKEIDVFLMPSHFEGFGFSLVEAMAAGCVPIASRISGVTDWIIKDNLTGYVVDKGNMKQMADYITKLYNDQRLLKAMSNEAATDSTKRFNLQVMGENYHKEFTKVLSEKSLVKERPWDEFTLDRAYQPTWRRFVPQNVKNWVRRLSA